MNPAASPTDAFSRTKIRDPFMEFFVHLPDGGFKTFDHRQMTQCGEFIKAAPKPLEVERSIHPGGDGVRAIANKWKRREKIVWQTPLSHWWDIDEVDGGDAHVMQEAKRLAEHGMPHKLIFAIYGVHPATLNRHCKKLGIPTFTTARALLLHS
jgi:hypothetical protein